MKNILKGISGEAKGLSVLFRFLPDSIRLMKFSDDCCVFLFLSFGFFALILALKIFPAD